MVSTLTVPEAVPVAETGDCCTTDETLEAAPSPAHDKASQQILTLAVDNMHCGGCMRSVERALQDLPEVVSARANLSQRRVVISTSKSIEPDLIVATLNKAGFSASPLSSIAKTTDTDRTADLSRRLGVAAFATMNIMLLSISVWSGADGDMGAPVQSLFHWLSALIALPAIVYVGQPFFSSALTALSYGRVNMDVPISIGVILAAGHSFYQTYVGSEQVYYDAAIMLLTFLLLGRLLDQFMRQRTATAADNLLKLKQHTVTVVNSNGQTSREALNTIRPGMQVLAAAGERLGVDGRVVSGRSSIDQSIITGESLPQAVKPGDCVFSGTLNLLQPLTIEVTAKEDQSLLSEIASLLANAEQQRGRYVKIADRAARLYAPLVHSLAALTFIGWLIAGLDWHAALPIAVAVLIITCPCAVALAVPAVQVAAAGRLLKSGVILKSPDALERLAECDAIVFDKTGTLTHGAPVLKNGGCISDSHLAEAASLARASSHPYSTAVLSEARKRNLKIESSVNVSETPGFGLKATSEEGERRFGSAQWCGIPETDAAGIVYYKSDDGTSVPFQFQDHLKDDVPRVLQSLHADGYALEIMSGDATATVASMSKDLQVDVWSGDNTPADKVSHLQKLADEGQRVAMVGDGLNDAPSLATAHASLSPGSATHISQTAADLVFQGDGIAPVAFALAIARNAHTLVKQNFAIAIGYNVIFVPLAIAGLVTPLIAAIAMSLSSVSVTANALRISLHQAETK